VAICNIRSLAGLPFVLAIGMEAFMKKSFLKQTLMGSLLVGLLALTACGKKDNGSGVRVAGRSSSVTAQVTSTCSTGQSAVGRIWDNSTPSTSNFEVQVKNFVSATIDPTTLGSIQGYSNSSTGVNFTAKFQFDSNNQIIPASSSLNMIIYDQKVYDSPGTLPYSIQFSQAYSGSIDRNAGTVVVTFQDSYGSITFSGRYDGRILSGYVTYQNFTAVAGYSAASGTLGVFSIYQCGVFN
jgi:hypothetical protein